MNDKLNPVKIKDFRLLRLWILMNVNNYCRLQSHNQLALKVSWTGFDCFNMADGLCIDVRRNR